MITFLSIGSFFEQQALRFGVAIEGIVKVLISFVEMVFGQTFSDWLPFGLGIVIEGLIILLIVKAVGSVIGGGNS